MRKRGKINEDRGDAVVFSISKDDSTRLYLIFVSSLSRLYAIITRLFEDYYGLNWNKGTGYKLGTLIFPPGKSTAFLMGGEWEQQRLWSCFIED